MIKYKIDILAALREKGYTSYKLINNKLMGNATIQKLRKNEVVYGNNLNLLCTLLNCQPGDILEYVPDNQDNI